MVLGNKCRLWMVKAATVAEKCHCRRIRRLSPFSGRFQRQSHFLRQSPISVTVWTGLYNVKRDYKETSFLWEIFKSISFHRRSKYAMF